MKKPIILNNLADLGTALKARRSELQITQQTLGNFCDLSHNGISRIEVGASDVRLTNLLKMAKILGLKVILEEDT